MNQKDAVYEAIRQLKPGEVNKDRPVALTKQEKHVVEEKLFDGFKRGRIQYNNELPSEDKLAMYVSGLVSNWLRKDRRLNGNTTYTPHHPGSRFNLPVVTPPQIPQVTLTAEQIEMLKKAGISVQTLQTLVKIQDDDQEHEESSASQPR